MNFNREERPRKWKFQQAQTEYALNFLGQGKGAVLALAADVPEKYYAMFSSVASTYHFIEQDPEVYRNLFLKTRERIGKDVFLYPTNFFDVPRLLGPHQKIKVLDFDTCRNYHEDHAWSFRKIFKSGKLCYKSVIRWTYCPRPQTVETINEGVSKIVKYAERFGYKVFQMPVSTYAETSNGIKEGTCMITGQMHLEKR